MSRFRSNCSGTLGLTLSNLGLFLASGMLLVFLLGGVYGGFWEREAEVRSTARSLNTCVETLSAAYSETTGAVTIPRNPMLVGFSCSCQYLRMESKASFGMVVSVTDRWLIPVWPRGNGSWQSGADLHQWLHLTSGHNGSMQDPVNQSVLENLTTDQQACAFALARDPLTLDAGRPVMVEKAVVVAIDGERGVFMLVYQNDSDNGS
jgi:hypothetical protein